MFSFYFNFNINVSANILIGNKFSNIIAIWNQYSLLLSIWLMIKYIYYEEKFV